MEDKEVGRLWQEANECFDPAGDFFLSRDIQKYQTRELIQKLVGERAMRINSKEWDGSNYPIALQGALARFGIPEDQWNSK